MDEHTPASKVSAPAGAGFFGYYPGSVAVITSRDGDRVNVMSAGWHTALSEAPPLYGVAVAPERHSHRLITDSQVFGVSFLPFDHAGVIAGSGLLSGADVDKFSRLGVGWQAGGMTGVPVPDVAFMTYECRVREQLTTGDHTFFVGDVVGLTYRPDAYAGGIQDSQTVPSVAYYGRSVYEELGSGRRQILPPAMFRTTPEETG